MSLDEIVDIISTEKKLGEIRKHIKFDFDTGSSSAETASDYQNLIDSVLYGLTLGYKFEILYDVNTPNDGINQAINDIQQLQESLKFEIGINNESIMFIPTNEIQSEPKIKIDLSAYNKYEAIPGNFILDECHLKPTESHPELFALTEITREEIILLNEDIINESDGHFRLDPNEALLMAYLNIGKNIIDKAGIYLSLAEEFYGKTSLVSTLRGEFDKMIEPYQKEAVGIINSIKNLKFTLKDAFSKLDEKDWEYFIDSISHCDDSHIKGLLGEAIGLGLMYIIQEQNLGNDIVILKGNQNSSPRFNGTPYSIKFGGDGRFKVYHETHKIFELDNLMECGHIPINFESKTIKKPLPYEKFLKRNKFFKKIFGIEPMIVEVRIEQDNNGFKYSGKILPGRISGKNYFKIFLPFHEELTGLTDKIKDNRLYIREYMANL